MKRIASPAALFLAMASAASADVPPPGPKPGPVWPVVAQPAVPPPFYVMALPAGISLVAVLPTKTPDLFDLDLRPEVVLPLGCGDKVAGLMRRGGPSLDGADAYDVILERRPVGECKKEATRVAARWAIRFRISDGEKRDLVLGERTLKVERKGGAITLDGVEATGDVPGAPPTADPATLVAGEVKSAVVKAVERVGAGDDAAVTIAVVARWPRCAGPPVAMLGRGDMASKFVLDRFTPVAVAPLDGRAACKQSIERKSELRTTVRMARGAGQAEITVGTVKLAVKPAEKPGAASVR